MERLPVQYCLVLTLQRRPGNCCVILPRYNSLRPPGRDDLGEEIEFQVAPSAVCRNFPVRLDPAESETTIMESMTLSLYTIIAALHHGQGQNAPKAERNHAGHVSGATGPRPRRHAQDCRWPGTHLAGTGAGDDITTLTAREPVRHLCDSPLQPHTIRHSYCL